MLEILINLGVDASAWLQASYPQLLDAMRLVSDFGRIEAALLLIPLIYWCLHKRFGIELMYILLVSGFINIFAKHLLRQPRPFWLDERLLLSDSGSGYGFPSGHVQSLAILLMAFASRFREAWLWLLTIVGVLVMALSRVYLGVHFLHDVLAGMLLAVIILLGVEVWKHFLAKRYKERIFGQRLLIAAVAPIVLMALWGLAVAWRGAPVLGEVEARWDELLISAENSSFISMTRNLALLLGLAVGFTFETSRVRFRADGVVWKRALRFVLGVLLLYGIWYGTEQAVTLITTDNVLWLAMPLRFLQYLLLGLVLSYYAPVLFVTLRLADVLLEPENQYSIKATSLPASRE